MPSVFRMCPNKLLSAAKKMTLNYTGKLPKVPQTTSTAAGKASSSNASSSSSAAAEQRLHDENADPNANSASTTPPLEKPSSGANANAAATSPQMFAVQKSEFIPLRISPFPSFSCSSTRRTKSFPPFFPHHLRIPGRQLTTLGMRSRGVSQTLLWWLMIFKSRHLQVHFHSTATFYVVFNPS